jgi:hypothetical protein
MDYVESAEKRGGAAFFGRWIRRQRPFPAAAGDDFVRATSEPAAVF